MQASGLVFIMTTISSLTTTPSKSPALAPPGAGIPAIERLIGGSLFALRRRFGTTQSFSTQFQRERALIAELCQRPYTNPTLCGSADLLSPRILIPRLRGLEDSSRYWSVHMTLDHLRIVNLGIARVISTLCSGQSPGRVIGTAEVKPSPDVTSSIIPDYESSCDRLLATVAAHTALKTMLKHPHPWFGPLDAHGWHAMSAMHMGIHRAQIARILLELDRSPA